jgi:hypothetical protein
MLTISLLVSSVTRNLRLKHSVLVSLFSDSLGMQLNLEKSGVKHHEKGTLFLGFKIYGDYGFNVKWRKNKDGHSQRVGDVCVKVWNTAREALRAIR